MNEISRKCLAEAIGTFCLVFAGTGAVVINDMRGGVTHVGIALTFGLIVMAMIYAIGDISGAHINPAVTIGFWADRRFPGAMVGPYIVSQLIGALAASGVLRWMFGVRANLGATLPYGPWQTSFVLEIILTFMLMFSVLCVVSGAKEKGLMAGAAIGGVVTLEALFAGPISGASMNPARSIGPAVVSGNVGDLWLYIVAPVAGSLLAVAVCRVLLVGNSDNGA